MRKCRWPTVPEAAPKALRELQYQFAAHLRDPAANPAPPGIEARRMKIYSDLFYNNMQGYLANAFPVLWALSADDRWHAMVRDFYARHRSHDPQFHGIPQEFLNYLEQERAPLADDPPWLLELAHYEWIELALTVAEDQLTPEFADPNGDLMRGIPVVSPVAQSLAYNYAVQKISKDYQPDAPDDEPTYLVVYRNRQHAVGFMQINAVTARMLELMEAAELTGTEVLSRLAEEMQHPDPQQVLAFGEQTLNGLRERDILLGTRRHQA